MTNDPAIAPDGTFIAPAQRVTDPDDNQFWHTLITGKDGNVPEHWYHGRFAPDTLKKGLTFAYGVCQAPTCTKPADECDKDHRRAWPHGLTGGANMWPLRPLGAYGAVRTGAYGTVRTAPPDEVTRRHPMDTALRPNNRRRTRPTRSLTYPTGC